MIYYLTVDTCIHCQKCISRMFNMGRKIEIGAGNIMSDIVIVLPRIFNKEYKEQLMKDIKAIWLEITGCNILEQSYITYDIKCSRLNPYGVDKTANVCCNKILNEELSRVPYKYMLVLGKAIYTVFPNTDHKKYITDGYRHIIWFSEFKSNSNYDKQALKDFLSKAINWIISMKMKIT